MGEGSIGRTEQKQSNRLSLSLSLSECVEVEVSRYSDEGMKKVQLRCVIACSFVRFSPPLSLSGEWRSVLAVFDLYGYAYVASFQGGSC